MVMFNSYLVDSDRFNWFGCVIVIFYFARAAFCFLSNRRDYSRAELFIVDKIL